MQKKNELWSWTENTYEKYFLQNSKQINGTRKNVSMNHLLLNCLEIFFDYFTNTKIKILENGVIEASLQMGC